MNETIWLNWLRAYETKDPEPLLKSMIKNKVLPDGAGYLQTEVDAHIHWHRRMTDAWMASGLAEK